MMPRLKEIYEKQIINNLCRKLEAKNKLVVPKLTKIILNMGLGNDANDQKKLKSCVNDMALISGQMPIITKAKKSISNFRAIARSSLVFSAPRALGSRLLLG